MQIRAEQDGHKLTITVEGSIDSKSAPALEAELTESKLKDIDEICFDMAGTEYITSMGLRVILAAFQIMDDKDGKVVLMHMNEVIKEVIVFTGFSDFAEIRD